MKVDYRTLKFSKADQDLYAQTILENPFIPSKLRPYPKQAAAIMYNSPRKLLGGNAFSGKSLMGAMLASQFLMYDNYTCLILRRTFDDVVAPGGIVEYLKNWLLDEERLGDLVCDHNENKRRFESPFGGRIYYNYSQRPGDKQKFKGRSFKRIIWDEASESPAENLSFIPRSLRCNASETQIPLTMYYISNPSLGTGTQYLLDEFVDDKGKWPYFELTFWDNKDIDAEDYASRLEGLDPIDRAFQLYGDWKFRPTNGMILNRRDYEKMQMDTKVLQQKIPDFNIVGVDLASTGDDKTACVSITHFSDGTTALTDSLTIDDSYTEEPIRQFLAKQKKLYSTYMIVFEKEEGASPEYAKRYWQGQLEDLLYQGKKVALEFYHPTDSKFERARPIAQSIRTKYLHIDKNLPDGEDLLSQFLYVHPNRKKMEEFPSPDVLDAAGLAFNHMSMYYKLGVDNHKKTYRMGVV